MQGPLEMMGPPGARPDNEGLTLISEKKKKNAFEQRPGKKVRSFGKQGCWGDGVSSGAFVVVELSKLLLLIML